MGRLTGPSFPPIRAEGLSKSFRRRDGSSVLLFRDMSLEIAGGEIVGLMGPSGRGKTTLGNILLGLLPADGGSVRWSGEELGRLAPGKRKTLRPRYQKIHQDPAASFPPRRTMTEVFRDFFRWGRLPDCLDREGWRQALAEGMEKASLSERLLGRYPCQLSGGELQRFALLRALLFDPLFLVADEPTSRLDPSVQARVAGLLTHEAEERCLAVLFISHDEALLEAVCSRILRLE